MDALINREIPEFESFKLYQIAPKEEASLGLGTKWFVFPSSKGNQMTWKLL